MPLPSSGPISLFDVQNELGGANPIGVDEYTGTTQVKSRYRYAPSQGGTLTITPGGAAYPPSGFTGLNDGSLDDNPQFNIAFNFNFKFLGVTYASLFISPNTYITFGSGSGQFGGLSASNPALPKIFLGASDHSIQRLSYKRGPENSYLRVRYEGTAGASGTPGSPNIVYEIIFYDPRSTDNLSKFDVYFGNHAGAAQIFRICSASADVLVPGDFGDPTEDTSLLANTAYSFSGDSNGNLWTVLRGGFADLLSINNPQGNMVQFSDFYGLSATPLSVFTVTAGRVPLFNGDNASSSGWPPTGYTEILNSTVDDNFYSIVTVPSIVPFTYRFNGTSYQNNIFVGTNSYITFGSGRSDYIGLSGSTPNVPTLHIGSADNSAQRIAYKSSTNYFTVRYEGTAATTGTPGSPNIVWEATFFRYEKVNLGSTVFSDDEWGHIIMLNVGTHSRTLGQFGISNGSFYLASGTIAAQTSYLIMGQAADGFNQRIQTNARMVNVSEGFN